MRHPSSLRAILIKCCACLVLAVSVLPSTAHAKDFEISPAMVPYVYRYGACLFNEKIGEISARIEKCKVLRTAIEDNSKEPFAFWHRGEGPRRTRQFNRALNIIETEAREAVETRKFVPEPVVTYMKCISELTIGSDNFRKGLIIDYRQTDPYCIGQISDVSGEMEAKRAERLFSRLRRVGGYIKMAGDVPTTVVFQNGFLGLYRLPADPQ
jgi:hypothetical protein